MENRFAKLSGLLFNVGMTKFQENLPDQRNCGRSLLMFSILGALLAPGALSGGDGKVGLFESKHRSCGIEDPRFPDFVPACRVSYEKFAKQVFALNSASENFLVYAEALRVKGIEVSVDQMESLFPEMDELHSRYPVTSKNWIRLADPDQKPFSSYLYFALRFSKYEMDLIGTTQVGYDRLRQHAVVKDIVSKQPSLVELASDTDFLERIGGAYLSLFPSVLSRLKLLPVQTYIGGGVDQDCVGSGLTRYQARGDVLFVDSSSKQLTLAMAVAHRLGHLCAEDFVHRNVGEVQAVSDEKNIIVEALACLYERHLFGKFAASNPTVESELLELHSIMWHARPHVGELLARDTLKASRGNLSVATESLQSELVGGISDEFRSRLAGLSADCEVSETLNSQFASAAKERQRSKMERLRTALLELNDKSLSQDNFMPMLKERAERIVRELEAYLDMVDA